MVGLAEDLTEPSINSLGSVQHPELFSKLVLRQTQRTTDTGEGNDNGIRISYFMALITFGGFRK